MKKTTRSAYIKERWKHHEDGKALYPKQYAYRDAEALDAIGYPWEPEVEPWPEEIAYSEDPDGDPYLAPASVPPIVGWGSPERRRAGYRECVRRWKGYHATVQALKRIAGGAGDRLVMGAASDFAKEVLGQLGEEVPE